MTRTWLVTALALVSACHPKERVRAEPDAGFGAPSPSALAAEPGDRAADLVMATCLACHSEEILRQQRLTAAQWEKVVKKMAGWGATLAADEVPTVSAYLATSYGVDAGTYEVATISAVEATQQIAPLDDGPFAAGNAERGGSLYGARCASCHGADARGQLGVNLVDRPLLYRAAEVANTIRRGRPKMPAQPETTEGEVADLLAYLRRAHVAR